MAKKPISIPDITLLPNEKVYFASDFHLGAPDKTTSSERELKIVQWLDQISDNAKAVFLVGDIFDFWFEYKHSIPKGFIRFQGRLAELRDRGIPIFLFTGNHDLWMSDYFPEELDIPVYKDPVSLNIGDKRIYVGHGDGLGSGDHLYKILKPIFSNKFCQWLFQWLHPNIGISIANFWSRRSRISDEKKEDPFRGEEERLFQYSNEIEEKEHHDFYIFGHRHQSFKMDVNANSIYFSLGDWVKHYSYLEVDEKEAVLKTFGR